MISLSMTLLSREKYMSLSTERFFLSKSFDGIYHGVYIDHKRSFDYMVKQSRDNEKKKKIRVKTKKILVITFPYVTISGT